MAPPGSAGKEKLTTAAGRKKSVAVAGGWFGFPW
jgi:hypothetical protein